MEALIFTVVGIVITLAITKAPIRIHITHENKYPTIPEQDLRELEKNIATQDNDLDAVFEEMGKTQSLFSGSDRV